MRLVFYDFEVYRYDWMVVFIDYETKKGKVIINNKEQLENFYNKCKSDIFIGYNSRGYDQFILKGILGGMNPYDISKAIIEEGTSGYQVVKCFKKFALNNFDISTGFHGLKQLEGFMGSRIKETSVPFDLDRPLTEQEINEVREYCIHDVQQTIEVFDNRKEEFESQVALIDAFNLPMDLFNKTKAQLSAYILGAEKHDDRGDEFDLNIVDCLRLNKYKFIEEWFRDSDNLDYSKKQVVDIYGVEHIIAYGGIHGAIPKYVGEGIFIMSDIASMYPATMINFNFLSRNVKDANKFREIRDTRIELKRNKDPRQAPYKIVLNSTYGASKDKFNPLFDPLMANNVCINGQLLIVDLLEKLEMHFGDTIQLIQSNTDGILVKLTDKSQFDEYLKICDEWCKRTGYELEHDEYIKVIQKDVNNYIIMDKKGKTKSKGAYVKKLSFLDYDLPIVNTALMDYFIKCIPVEDTINNCDKLIEFQKIVKVSSKYMYALHGERKLDEKVLRVFASNNPDAKGVFKVKTEERIEKIANTPMQCFINNENIKNEKVPPELDKQYYIDIAKKRISDFIEVKKKGKKKSIVENQISLLDIESIS